MAKVKLSAEEIRRQETLEAVRQALDGLPHVLCGKGGLFAAKSTETALAAVRDGYLESCEPPPSPKRTKKVPPQHVRITDRGRQLLLDEVSPKAVLEELLPLVRELMADAGARAAAPSPADTLKQSIRQQFDAFPPETFRATVQAQLEKVQTALETKVEQAIAGLRAELLAAVADAIPPAPPPEPVGPLLRSVHQAIERALAAPPPSLVPESRDERPEPPEPAAGQPRSLGETLRDAGMGMGNALPTSAGLPKSHDAVAPKSLDAVLHDTYENLCLLMEYKHDRLVDLPRLYYEAKKVLPHLEVAEYHAELLRLWRDREVMLHILNEGRRAVEPDLGISHDSALYYNVSWNET